MGLWSPTWRKATLFLLSALTGVVFAFMWKNYQSSLPLHLRYAQFLPATVDYSRSYRNWVKRSSKMSVSLSQESISYGSSDAMETEAQFLYREVPIICMVLTTRQKSARAVGETWGKHCNKVIFFGSYESKVVENVPMQKWNAIPKAILRVAKGYGDEYNWMFIADDITYAVIENLRYLVAGLNSSIPHYLGHAVRHGSWMYNHLSSGIVLSKGAWTKLTVGNDVLGAGKEISGYISSGEDLVLGKMLDDLGVTPVDTRDLMGRGKFNLYDPQTLLIPGSLSMFSFYWRRSIYISNEGSNCCSDFAVTFHDMDPHQMHVMEYLVYHLRPFYRGGVLGGITPPPPPGKKNSLADFKQGRAAIRAFPMPDKKEQQWKRKQEKKEYLTQMVRGTNASITEGPNPKNVTIKPSNAIIIHNSTVKISNSTEILSNSTKNETQKNVTSTVVTENSKIKNATVKSEEKIVHSSKKNSTILDTSTLAEVLLGSKTTTTAKHR